MNWQSFLRDNHPKFPKDSHALFSPSNYHWLNYSMEKMTRIITERDAKKFGTDIHSLACDLIRMKVKLPDNGETLSMYVNDAILFGMYPEKQLYYSEEFRGTADAVVVDENDVLRIHDLKTGVTKASMRQLEIYVALFCLDMGCSPADFSGMELRIYQNNEIYVSNPEVDVIVPIIDKIVTVDRLISKIGRGESYE